MIIGSDFAWENAHFLFYNYDNMIKMMRDNESFSKKYKIKYSSPIEYYNEIKHCHFDGFKGEEWDPDMFIYADDEEVYWTGYFTSRPLLKQTLTDVNAQFYAQN